MERAKLSSLVKAKKGTSKKTGAARGLNPGPLAECTLGSTRLGILSFAAGIDDAVRRGRCKGCDAYTPGLVCLLAGDIRDTSQGRPRVQGGPEAGIKGPEIRARGLGNGPEGLN